jgi:hypothetical protein
MYEFLRSILSLIQSLLELVNPWGMIVAAATAGLIVIKRLALHEFLAPSVKVAKLCEKNLATVVLRNFEAIAIDKAVNLRAAWKPGNDLVRIRFRAGPWLYRGKQPSVYPETSDSGDHAVVVQFNGLPADGAVVVSFEFRAEISRPNFWVELGQVKGQAPSDTVPIRRLSKIETFSPVVGITHYSLRLALGLASYLVGAAYLFPAGDMPSTVDAAVTVGGLVLVFLAWFVALPLQGKDTVCGYPEDGEWTP